MFTALWVCAVFTTFEPNSVSAHAQGDTEVMADYRAASARAGHDADAQVRLALWCEAHGMPAERLEHLCVAIMKEPSHATARGLMGLVAFRGRWQSPDAVSACVEADTSYAAALARYSVCRARMGDSADAHWKLALWCEQQGLRPEATAHLMRVVQLEPGREAAWKRLGYRKQGRRWVTAEQIATERAENKARKAAERRWSPLLNRWRNWVGDKAREAELAEALATVTDPRAVPLIWAIFGRGNAPHQEAAVQLLGQIDSPDATRALTLLALDGRSPVVRARAAQTLRLRDHRDVASLLVVLLRDPEPDPDPILFHYRLTPVAWDSVVSPGILLIRGPRYDFLRTYTLDEGFNTSTTYSASLALGPSFAERVMAQRERQIRDLAVLVERIRRESADYVLAAREHVRRVERSNTRVIDTLGAATGQSLGRDREAWRKWCVEERGYAYGPPPLASRQDLTIGDSKPTYFDNVHLSCFAAGTTVRTLGGPRSIESIAVGDQVLTQDPYTGALSYHPVVEAPHNPPDKLLQVDIDGAAVKTTGIHRFWKVGRGWVMARDLKPGDAVRTLGGGGSVKSVEPAGIEPVYNLKVLQAESFFVGGLGLLVHDNSEVQHVSEPFDAMPEFSASRAPERFRK